MTTELSSQGIGRILSGFGTDADSHLLWAGQLGKRLLQLKLILDRVDHVVLIDSGFSASYRLLAAIQQSNPSEVRRLLLSPQFGAWLSTVMRKTAEVAASERTSPSSADRQLRSDLASLGGFTAVAALQTGATFQLRTSVLESRLFLPTLGFVEITELYETYGLAEISATRDGRLRISELASRMRKGQRSSRRRWRSIPTVEALENIDPDFIIYLDYCDHYIAECSTLPLERAPLADAGIARWHSQISRAIDVIRRRHGGQLPMVRAWVKVIVPAIARPGARISASSKDMPGALVASLPADALELAESIVHEVQHFKLNALDDLTPLCIDPDMLLPVPWRSDEERPALALAQGAYAFMSVAEFLKAEYQYSEHPIPANRIDRLLDQIGTAVHALQRSRNLTSVGNRLVEVLQRRLTRIQSEL